MMKLSS